MAADVVLNAGRAQLLVEGAPFLILGGEVHNSSASGLEWMEEKVWPVVRQLRLNTLLVPVYWETVEPREGEFHFELVDGVLAQARREGVRLVLLWFGLWKNALSTYAPSWVKQDTKRFFRSELFEQLDFVRSRPGISPCCQAAIDADAKAFAALMAHLKKVDEVQGTVLFLQVENEVGLLGSDRDYSPIAQQWFEADIPREVAANFDCGGNWESAFGGQACSQFMAWCFARALEVIASAGKKEYDIPLYVNAWTIQYDGEYEGSYPTGGPVVENIKMWRLTAPSIAWYSPDIYKNNFAAECRKYALQDNPLFIPEARNSLDAGSNALYAIAQCGAFGFCPFAVEDMLQTSQAFELPGAYQEQGINGRRRDETHAAHYLKEAYGVLDSLKPFLSPQAAVSVQGYIFEDDRRIGMRFCQYRARITCIGVYPHLPLPAGVVIEMAEDEFIIAGILSEVEFLPLCGERSRPEFLSLEEGYFSAGQWHCTRIMNGDEHRVTFTDQYKILRIKLRKDGR